MTTLTKWPHLSKLSFTQFLYKLQIISREFHDVEILLPQHLRVWHSVEIIPADSLDVGNVIRGTVRSDVQWHSGVDAIDVVGSTRWWRRGRGNVDDYGRLTHVGNSVLPGCVSVWKQKSSSLNKHGNSLQIKTILKIIFTYLFKFHWSLLIAVQ